MRALPAARSHRVAACHVAPVAQPVRPGLAPNKQKLHREGAGFLRDELSLAHYNVGADITLTLGTRERGGRKK